MALWLLQQVDTFIALKFRDLFLKSPDADFLCNRIDKDDYAEHDFGAINLSVVDNWVGDPVIRIIEDPCHAAFVDKIAFCNRRTRPEHKFLLCYLKEFAPENGRRPRKSVVLIERLEDCSTKHDETNAKAPGAVLDNPVNDRLKMESNGLVSTSMAQEALHGHPHPEGSASDTNTEASHSADHLRTPQNNPSSSSSFQRVDDHMTFSRNGNETFVQFREGRYDVGAVLALPPKSFTLLQLTTLFHMVHAKRRDPEDPATAGAYNCHWLAGSIYCSISKLVAGSTEKRTWWDMVTHKGLSSPLPGDPETEEFVREFGTHWENVQQKIAAARERANRPLLEARQARLEAEAELQKSEVKLQKTRQERLDAEERGRQHKAEIQRLQKERELEGTQFTATLG